MEMERELTMIVTALIVWVLWLIGKKVWVELGDAYHTLKIMSGNGLSTRRADNEDETMEYLRQYRERLEKVTRAVQQRTRLEKDGPQWDEIGPYKTWGASFDACECPTADDHDFWGYKVLEDGTEVWGCPHRQALIEDN